MKTKQSTAVPVIVASILIAAGISWLVFREYRNTVVSDLIVEHLILDELDSAMREVISARRQAVAESGYTGRISHEKYLKMRDEFRAQSDRIQSRLNAQYGVNSPRLSDYSLAKSQAIITEKEMFASSIRSDISIMKSRIGIAIIRQQPQLESAIDEATDECVRFITSIMKSSESHVKSK